MKAITVETQFLLVREINMWERISWARRPNDYGKGEKGNAGGPCLLELVREGCRVLGQTHSIWSRKWRTLERRVCRLGERTDREANHQSTQGWSHYRWVQIGRVREDVKYVASQTEGRGRGVSAREENRRQWCPTCQGGKKRGFAESWRHGKWQTQKSNRKILASQTAVDWGVRWQWRACVDHSCPTMRLSEDQPQPK